MDAFVDSAAIQKWIQLGKEHDISVMGGGVDYYYSFDQEPTKMDGICMIKNYQRRNQAQSQ